MKLFVPLLAALAWGCSGGGAQGSAAGDAPDQCADGQKSDCEIDGKPGTRSCVVGDQGFVWGTCVERLPDQCKPGDVMHCYAEGSPLRNQYGDLSTTCMNIDGRWSYRPDACATPLVLAFDDGPVVFTQAPGNFDLFGQQASIGSDWVSSRTPWLVLDRNGDGDISDGSELFGSMTPLGTGERARDGFSALAQLDADADGRITALDPSFARLQLWFDADQDRRVSASELRSLASARIEAIELSYRMAPRCNPSGCELERAGFSFRDELGELRSGAVIDVHLRAR